MKATLLARLQRLESKTEVNSSVMFRYGWLRPLPSDFIGKKHAVIVGREPTTRPNVEWCEFEDPPGAGTTELFRRKLHRSSYEVKCQRD
jgi:hypothetical protein